MSQTYRVFGSELSPYSVKVRSYFRYKRIPHEWIPRSSANQTEFDKHAKLPLIPLVVTPDGAAMQDSTPILDRMEALHPEPSIHPSEPTTAFLSALIEEYADEWGNKPMFHYRWYYEADQQSAGERIARGMMPDLPEEQLPGVVSMVKERMVGRLALVGSSPATSEQIEASLVRQLEILERHLAERPYLFGGRPAMGDFGLYAQLYECSTDPTPGTLMAGYPKVMRWIGRMLDPSGEGDFEAWPALAPTLTALLSEEIGNTFFPWTIANERAIAAGEKGFSLPLGGKPFAQDVQKYHAKSLAVLRDRYARITDKSDLDEILRATSCHQPLQGSSTR